MTFPSQSQKRDRFSEKETCPVLFREIHTLCCEAHRAIDSREVFLWNKSKITQRRRTENGLNHSPGTL